MIIILLAFAMNVDAQFILSGRVVDIESEQGIASTEVYNQQIDQIVLTNENGYFEFKGLKKGRYDITIFTFDYSTQTKTLEVSENINIEFKL